MPNVRRTKTGEKVWITWDCQVCGYKRIHGSKRECPGCGRPRGNTVKFNTGDIVGEVSKDEVSRYNSPDWFCECCDSYNNDNDEFCIGCGAPKGASKDYFQKQKELEESTTRERQEHQETEQYDAPIVRPSFNSPKPKKIKFSSLFKYISITAVTAIALIAFIFLLLPKEKSACVTDMNWERSIAVEHLDTLKDDGWDPPYDARILDKEWKIREHDKKIFDHYDTVPVEVQKSEQVYVGDDISYEYEENGNGTLDRIEVKTPKYETHYYTETELQEVPVYRYEDVYDWYYYYEYDRWRTSRYVETSGTYEETPEWGEVILANREREGSKSEKYTVTGISGKDKEISFTLSYEDYKKVHIGDELTIKVNTVTGHATLVTINGDVVGD